MKKKGHEGGERIAGLATVPGRTNALRTVIEGIVPQVDVLHIACNNHDGPHPLDVPDAYSNVVWHYPDSFPQDGNKFLYLGEGDGYRFTLDDDIIYPPTYIQDSIDGLEKYKRKYVISWGGKRFDLQPVHSYYKGASFKCRSLDLQAKDMLIHVPLTGGVVWHTSQITFYPLTWLYPLMSDIWAGLACLEAGFPVMSLAHASDYIKPNDKEFQATTIWTTEHERDEIQTGLVTRDWRCQPAT